MQNINRFLELQNTTEYYRWDQSFDFSTIKYFYFHIWTEEEI